MSRLPPIPERFTQVDGLNLPDHYFLDEADECYFLWEWVKGARFDENEVNQFIKNYQIGPEHKSSPRWFYKEKAIGHGARALAATLQANWVRGGTFVPIPPSKIRADSGHDSRLVDTLKRLKVRPPNPPFDMRELVLQIENNEAKQKGISPQERAENWCVDHDAIGDDEPSRLYVFDDMLTTGSHYKGMEIVLKEQFPDTEVVGVFLTRRIDPSNQSVDLSEVDDIDSPL